MFWYNKIGTESAKKIKITEDKKMGKHYPKKYKKEVVEVYLRGGSSVKQTAMDYNVAESTLREWVKKYSEECQNTTKDGECNMIEEIKRLNKELKEKEKEIYFLKKATAFFAKEID